MTEMPDPFEGLRRRFLERCARDAAQLRAVADQRSDEVIEIVHRLSGTAGTLGFVALGACAAELEDAIRDAKPASEKMHELLRELDKVHAV